MAKLEIIVEGDGEVTAGPVILYKVLHHLGRFDVHVGAPKNAHGKGNLTALAVEVEESFGQSAWYREPLKP